MKLAIVALITLLCSIFPFARALDSDLLATLDSIKIVGSGNPRLVWKSIENRQILFFETTIVPDGSYCHDTYQLVLSFKENPLSTPIARLQPKLVQVEIVEALNRSVPFSGCAPVWEFLLSQPLEIEKYLDHVEILHGIKTLNIKLGPNLFSLNIPDKPKP